MVSERPIHPGRTRSDHRRVVQIHTTDLASDRIDPIGPGSSIRPGLNDLRPLRVLVVDDGGAASRVVEQLDDGIEDGRYVVARATTLTDGLEAIAEEEHDVCVVDHHIGVRTGFDLLASVTTEERDIPIVFVAQAGDHGTGVTAVGAGASCYIVEDGIGSEHLDQCLRQAVEERRTLSRLVGAGVAIDGGTPTKAQIFSHIAERLGSPATAILESTRSSLESQLPDHVAESLAVIEDQVATILTLAHDINDLSMFESGSLRFDATPFSLRGLVAGVKRIFGSTSESGDFEIVDRVSAHVPNSLIGDPGRLRLVLVRFIDNVARRSWSDRVLLTIDADENSTDIVTLRVEITAMDTFPAIEPPMAEIESDGADEELPEFQHHAVLGIPIALETIALMGGHVTVGSETGRPASIQFTIRLEISNDDVRSRPIVDRQASSDSPILIIANSLADRRSIVKTLGDAELPHIVNSSVEDWNASTHTNGGRGVVPALAVIASTDDSFATCDQFRALASDIPIVVIASTGRRGDAARCRDHDVGGYLAQPIDPGDLVDVINATSALVYSGDTSTLVTRHWLREGRRSLHVLVVDDSSTNRFLMTRMLDQRGHSTESACDGEDAVEMFERDTFDVVVMDIMMPGIDGYEATRMIRAKDAGSIRQPLIVGVSAFSDQSTAHRSRSAGMDAMVDKPIRPDDLFALVEQQSAAGSTRTG